MHKIDAASQLKEAILFKEIEHASAKNRLKDEIHVFYEKLKPSNILQASIKEIAESSQLKSTVVDTSIGMVAGYLSKTLVVRGSKNPFLRLLGSATQFAISTIVSKNPKAVRSVGDYVLKNVFPKAGTETEKVT